MNKKMKIGLIYFIKSITTGLFIGMMIGLYQLIAHKVISHSNNIYNNKSYLIIMLMVILSFVFAFIIDKGLKYAPYASGSGIPQIEAHIRGKVDIKWYKALPMMFIGSLYSFFMGLALGSEGPSVQIGASIGIMMNDLYNQEDDIDNIGISSGTGFGCAFLSPLAGIIYTFEESLHHVRFNFVMILRTILTIIIAYFTTRIVNHHKIINLTVNKYLDIKYYYIVLIVAIISFVSSFLFKKAIIGFKDFLNKYKNSFIVKNRLYVAVLISLLLGYFLNKYNGGGAKIISNILSYSSIKIVIFIIVFRFIYTIISANSRLCGGLLVPQFCIGALNGLLICLILNKGFDLDPSYYDIIIFISMLTMFAYVTHSPLTAIALAITHASFKYVLIPMIIITLLGKLFIKIFKDEDIYELLIERL